MSLTSLIIIVVLQSTSVQALPNCGQVIPIDGLYPNGSFASPGWPNPYQPNKNCKWSISSLPGTYIKLTVTDFNLQSDPYCKDKVLIRPGNEAGVKLCAHSINVPFVSYSSNNQFEVTFIADETTVSQSTGFRAEYKALQATCPPNTLDGSLSGRISSPNFPDHYPSNMYCGYNITVPKGYHVELNFTTFVLEDTYDVNCTNDYVLVETNQQDIWRLCGKTSNMLSYRSVGRRMLVTFVSDHDIIARGFEAMFEAIQETPIHEITSSFVVLSTASPHERVPRSTVELVSPSKTLTISTPGMTAAQETDFLAGPYRSIPNHTIRGHSIRKLSIASEIACVLLCQQSYDCKSVTYLPPPQSPGLCTLHKTNVRKTPGSVEEENHVMYYELVS